MDLSTPMLIAISEFDIVISITSWSFLTHAREVSETTSRPFCFKFNRPIRELIFLRKCIKFNPPIRVRLALIGL